MSDRLLTVPQVAERLSVSRVTVYELFRRGDLPSLHVGTRSRRVPESALDAFIAERMHSTGTAA